MKNRVLGVDLRTLLVQDRSLGKTGEVPYVLQRIVEAIEAQVGQQSMQSVFQSLANFANMRAAVSLLNNGMKKFFQDRNVLTFTPLLSQISTLILAASRLLTSLVF